MDTKTLEQELFSKVARIGPLSEKARAAAKQRQHDLAKPRGSLGRLEELAIQIAAIQDTERPRHENKLMIVCAGDHGVTDEQISPYPPSVTRQQISNFSKGGGTITTLSREVGAKVVLADLGVNFDFPENTVIRDYKIAKGTQNMSLGPAMTRAQALKSLLAGFDLVDSEPAVDFVAAGEMGIGNTSPSSAICAVLTGRPVAEVTGAGSGLNQAQIQHKITIIERALAINKPDPDDPLDILAKVGGLEIGAMAGVMLAGAARRAAVFIDGFIAGAAALLAEKIRPGVRDYFIGGHRSLEKAHMLILEHLNLRPLLDLDMRLGEGSGSVVAMFIGQCACAHHNNMRTMAEAMIDDTIR